MRQAHRAQGDALRCVALLALAFTLLACNGSPDPDDVAPTATPQPTLVPSPVATLDPRAGDLVPRGALGVNPATSRLYLWMATPAGDREEVWVVDGGTLETTARIEIPGGCAATDDAAAIAADGARNRVYVTGCDADAVWVIDGARDEVLGALSVRAARGVVVDAARARVYVHSAERIVVLDVETGDTAGRIDLEPVRAFDVDAATGRILALVEDGGATAVIDPETLEVLAVVSHDGFEAALLAVDRASHRVFAYRPGEGNVFVIDGARADSIGARPFEPIHLLVTDGLRGHVIAVPSRGSIVSLLDAATWTALATIPVARDPGAVAVDEAAGRIWVWGLGGVTVIDVDPAGSR